MSSQKIGSRPKIALVTGVALLITTLVAVGASAVPPSLTAEEPVSDPVYGTAIDRQFMPAIAWNGTNHLAVWQDGRLGDSSGIWGSLLDDSGTPTSVGGMPISTNGDTPEVATDGDDFLVAWSQSNGVYGTIVQADGSVGTPFEIRSVQGSQQSEVDVAFDGTNYLVVWTSYTTEGDIVATRVDPTGDVLDDPPITLSDAMGGQSGPAVASAGVGGWFVAWTDSAADASGDIYGTAVAANGSVHDADGVVLVGTSDAENTVRLASNGTNYLLSWALSSNSTGEHSLIGTRLDASGTILDASGITIFDNSDYLSVGKMTSNGSDYLVTWFNHVPGNSSQSAHLGAIVAGDDGAVDVADIYIAPFGNGDLSSVPAAAFGGTDYVVLYGDGDISSETIATDGTPGETDQIITLAPPEQSAGDIAGADGTYVAAWQQSESGPDSVYVGRLDADGSPLDGDGTPLFPGNQSKIGPQIAWNGTSFLVVWVDYANGGSAPDAFAARLDANATLIDVVPLQLAVGPNQVRRVDVASVGDDFLVVWEEQASDGNVRGRIVHDDGSLSTAFPIDAGTESQIFPSVAANAGRYLVTWLDAATDPDSVTTATVSATGTVGTHRRLSSGTARPISSTVASDGSGFLVTWSSHDDDTNDSDIWERRVGNTGKTLGPATQLTDTDTADESLGALGWDGTNYVLYYGLYPASLPAQDVARRITPDGYIVDRPAFQVSGLTGTDPVAIGSAASGDARFMYVREAPELGSVRRLFTKGMNDPAVPAAAMRAPKVPFQKAKRFGVAWTKPSAEADVRYRKATSSAGFGDYVIWKTGATSTSATYEGRPGNTYCFSARSRNADDGLFVFSAARCTAVPLDDRALTAKGTWNRSKGNGYYLNTFSASSTKGSSLSRNVRAKRVALLATKCPGCGTVKVFLGKKLLKKVSLAASSTQKKRLIGIASFSNAKAGKIRIVVITAGKTVKIEGLGVSAA